MKNIHPTHKFILPSVCSAKYPTTNIDICLKCKFKNIPSAVTFCLAKTVVNGLWSTGGFYHGNEHDWLAIDLGPDPYAVKAFMVGHRFDCCAYRNTVLTFLVGNEMPNVGTPVSSLNLDRYMPCAEWPYVGQVCNQPTPSFYKQGKIAVFHYFRMEKSLAPPATVWPRAQWCSSSTRATLLPKPTCSSWRLESTGCRGTNLLIMLEAFKICAAGQIIMDDA